MARIQGRRTSDQVDKVKADEQEQHSYPIFSPDWGADEELLLVSGLMKDGLGNWQEAATHIGTRTKEDCEAHYHAVYLGVGPDGKELEHVWESESEDGRHAEGPPRKKRRRDFMPVRPFPSVLCFFLTSSQWRWKSKWTILLSRRERRNV
jgi:hypothetical protein